jgi:hypothetical protein
MKRESRQAAKKEKRDRKTGRRDLGLPALSLPVLSSSLAAWRLSLPLTG